MTQKNKSYFDLRGRVVIITGGAGYLGVKHAEAIAEYGAIPILLDIINLRSGNKLAKKISSLYETECSYFKCDIRQENQINSIKNLIITKYRKIDALINNAANNPKISNEGSPKNYSLENFSLNIWENDLSVGLKGAMLCSKIFGKEMIKNSKGVIINVSSDLGIIGPDQRIYLEKNKNYNERIFKPVSYSVVKHGLIGLTKYIATYWADKGIRCNAICPGGVKESQSKNFINNLSNLIPLSRMADPNEYKAAIVFLASDASSYMTGANLVIDGGRTAW
tara:strand:+ start:6877 stop:7713 length:837 start_codon:yes stop_codon:yes gene_type:complete